MICIGEWSYPIGTPMALPATTVGTATSAAKASEAELQKWRDQGFTVLDPREDAGSSTSPPFLLSPRPFYHALLNDSFVPEDDATEEKGYGAECDDDEEGDFEYIPEKVRSTEHTLQNEALMAEQYLSHCRS